MNRWDCRCREEREWNPRSLPAKQVIWPRCSGLWCLTLDLEWLSHAHDPKTCIYGFPTLLAVGTTEEGKVQLSLERHLHNRVAVVWGWERISAVGVACSAWRLLLFLVHNIILPTVTWKHREQKDLPRQVISENVNGAADGAFEGSLQADSNMYLSLWLSEKALQSLLESLTCPPYTPTQHLEREQALAKEFAEILHFTLRFDELKVRPHMFDDLLSLYWLPPVHRPSAVLWGGEERDVSEIL